VRAAVAVKELFRIGLKIAKLLDELEPEARRDLVRQVYRVHVGPTPEELSARRSARYRARHALVTANSVTPVTARHGQDRDDRVMPVTPMSTDSPLLSDFPLLSLPVTPSSFLSSSETTGAKAVPAWPASLNEIPDYLAKISAPAEFSDPPYWTRIDAWLGSEHSGVGYLDELPKYLAWSDVQPNGTKHRHLRRGFRNWLAKSEYWSQARAQTQAIRKR
jgi:hypothetical protein